jgi:ribosomal protein L11 methyltransferase
MGLHEIRAEIVPEELDRVESVLLESGLDRWTLQEDAVAKRAWVVGVFENAMEAGAGWGQLRSRMGDAQVGAPVLRELADCDWRESYKAHFKAWHFGRLHWIPVWERGSSTVPAGEKVLWLDPGLAFGTGNHETTRLCVERLVALAEGKAAEGRVIDAGCGSGILALSAALLGFREIAGFDNDPEAIQVSNQNAALNELGGRVHFFTGDLQSGLDGRTGSVVLANIQADILMRFAPELISAVEPGGTLVLSGILAVEVARVRSAFHALNPSWISDSRVLGEWCDLTLFRPAG